MQFPRFEARIPFGKQIDLLLAQRRWQEAIVLLKKAESQLTLTRKNRGNRMLKFPTGSKQRHIDDVQIEILNRKLDKICATLRGNQGIFWKVSKRTPKNLRKPKITPRFFQPRH